MLNYALVFLLIALVAGLLGFTGLAAGVVWIAKILFFVFLALFVVALIIWFRRGRRSQFPDRLGTPDSTTHRYRH